MATGQANNNNETIPFYSDKFADVVTPSTPNDDFSDVPLTPFITPDYYSTTYNLPDTRRHDMNVYAGLHKNALQNAGLRHNYVLSPDESEVYMLAQSLETEEYCVYYPYSLSSTSPVYIVFAGSHTASMYAEALMLAQINQSNASGNSYDDYASFQIAKQLPLTVSGDTAICPVSLGRQIVMTGCSLGGTKGLYSYYHNSDIISKAILFNPWLGEWQSGIRFDPKDQLNPWHDQRLSELHSLNVGEALPFWVENLHTHYIEGEFGLKISTLITLRVSLLVSFGKVRHSLIQCVAQRLLSCSVHGV